MFIEKDRDSTIFRATPSRGPRPFASSSARESDRAAVKQSARQSLRGWISRVFRTIERHEGNPGCTSRDPRFSQSTRRIPTLGAMRHGAATNARLLPARGRGIQPGTDPSDEATSPWTDATRPDGHPRPTRIFGSEQLFIVDFGRLPMLQCTGLEWSPSEGPSAFDIDSGETGWRVAIVGATDLAHGPQLKGWLVPK